MKLNVFDLLKFG